MTGAATPTRAGIAGGGIFDDENVPDTVQALLPTPDHDAPADTTPAATPAATAQRQNGHSRVVQSDSATEKRTLQPRRRRSRVGVGEWVVRRALPLVGAAAVVIVCSVVAITTLSGGSSSPPRSANSVRSRHASNLPLASTEPPSRLFDQKHSKPGVNRRSSRTTAHRFVRRLLTRHRAPAHETFVSKSSPGPGNASPVPQSSLNTPPSSTGSGGQLVGR